MFILVCEEYPPHPGGVAYFSDALAKRYFREDQLRGVISLSESKPRARVFPVLHVPLQSRKYGSMLWDKFVLTRKINSAFFKLYNSITGESWWPVVRALHKLKYKPDEDVLFFTYQVHHPKLFKLIYDHFKGRQWVLYHGLDLLGFRDYPKDVNDACKVADKVLFNSKATQSLFIDLGFSASAQEVMYPFLDEEYLKALKFYSLAVLEERIKVPLRNSIIVSSVCRLIRRKGIHIAIGIIEGVLKKTGANIQYLVVGDGPETDNLKKLVQERELTARIHFLGYVDDAIKYSILKHSRIFLMPNFDDGGKDFEGFGISFLEAAYFGNYVVGGNHGGAAEAIAMLSDADSLDVSNPEDVERIKQKIISKCVSLN